MSASPPAFPSVNSPPTGKAAQPRFASQLLNAHWQNVLLAGVILAGGGLLWYLSSGANPPSVPLGDSLQDAGPAEQVAFAQPAKNPAKPLTLATIPFDGQKAYEYLKQICAIGPRVSGTPGMEKQQKLLIEHFEKLGAKVSKQEFLARHPLTGEQLTLANLVIKWHPDRQERILLCAHYDTRPYPDRDPRNPQGVFIGANDGASGVALLMELGKQMPALKGAVGVDFVLFDAEELIYGADTSEGYFLGSGFFAKEYATGKWDCKYRWGVLLDMIADKNLELPVEPTSWSWAESQPLIKEIWLTARDLGVSEFQNKIFDREIQDDHLMLYHVGKIPSVDIIDMNYKYWHTTQDTPANCSALSLAKVGYVLQEWLKKATEK
ncbi:MAG: M28 family peptidase [Pirellulales bacterium]|nr:M28 family peptidase [Pirellulales bacterium]